MNSFPGHTRILPGVILYRPYSGNHIRCEFMNTTVSSYSEDNGVTFLLVRKVIEAF